MTLNKNNWIVRYYYWINSEYPTNLCPFFWGSLLIIVLFPFMVLGRVLIGKKDPDAYESLPKLSYFTCSAMVYLFWFIFAGFGNSLMKIYGYEFTHWTGVVFLGLLMGIVHTGLFLGFIYGIYWIYSKIAKATRLKMPETHVIQNTKDIFAAITDKYCTKITIRD